MHGQWERGESGSTLVSLACTCRAISDVCLDVIWRDLSDLSALFRLMPSIRMNEYSQFVYVSLEEEDRKKALPYAARIRKINNISLDQIDTALLDQFHMRYKQHG